MEILLYSCKVTQPFGNWCACQKLPDICDFALAIGVNNITVQVSVIANPVILVITKCNSYSSVVVISNKKCNRTLFY